MVGRCAPTIPRQAALSAVSWSVRDQKAVPWTSGFEFLGSAFPLIHREVTFTWQKNTSPCYPDHRSVRYPMRAVPPFAGGRTAGGLRVRVPSWGLRGSKGGLRPVIWPFAAGVIVFSGDRDGGRERRGPLAVPVVRRPGRRSHVYAATAAPAGGQRPMCGTGASPWRSPGGCGQDLTAQRSPLRVGVRRGAPRRASRERRHQETGTGRPEPRPRRGPRHRTVRCVRHRDAGSRPPPHVTSRPPPGTRAGAGVGVGAPERP